MKLKTVLIVICSILVCTCVCVFAAVNLFKTKNYHLKIANQNITLFVDDTVNLISYCNIDYKSNIESQRPTFVSSNINIVEVNPLFGDAVCKMEGTVEIIVKLKLKDDSVLQKTINITINPKLILPTTAYFDSTNLQISKNFVSTNKLNVTGETNITPLVTYQNHLVTYDVLTGKVTAGNVLGQDVVTVTFKKSNTEVLTCSFNVTVCDESVLTIDCTLNVNQTKLVEYTLPTSLPNQTFSKPIIKDDSIVAVLDSAYSYVYIKALKVGITNITITSSAVTIIINVIVT